ncbi:hypothetical protein RR48_02666 [Papilio machaon]|uniref:MADF domain-containing protein n=1 Tax=Papilio machaon TaxID=76193 RepID=A0A0N1PG71_PAPMA|nr:hypothetical protein RR48_02666 [Papilio machaon]
MDAKMMSYIDYQIKPKKIEQEDRNLSFFRGKQVSTKWNNIRDSWLKTGKKQKDESKSGSSTKKTRNYLYHDQLTFLKKVSEPRPPHESVSKKARTETEVGMESDFRSPLIKDKRKEVNDRMVKFLDSRINPEKENHHLSFFKGIIAILNTLTIEETLEFQASVMTMLQKIKSRNYERPNYGPMSTPMRDSYNQMTGPDQYSGYYTHNSVNQQATPTQDQHHPGYSMQSSNQQATSIPSTSSQTSNQILASPSASSIIHIIIYLSIHSQDSDYLDFEGIFV